MIGSFVRVFVRAQKTHVFTEMCQARIRGRVLHVTNAYRHGGGSAVGLGILDEKHLQVVRGESEIAVAAFIDIGFAGPLEHSDTFRRLRGGTAGLDGALRCRLNGGV